MSDLREYKCPACGGAIEFDSKSQKMKCPYCDTEFELETLKELDEQMEREAGQQDDLSGWQTDAGGEWQEGETDGMNVYTCQSCGGEIIADENTGASNCPYCGNPVIMTEKFKGALRPDLVILCFLTQALHKIDLNIPAWKVLLLYFSKSVLSLFHSKYMHFR